MKTDFYKPTSTNRIARIKEMLSSTKQTEVVKELMSDGVKRTSVEVSNLLGMNLNSARRCLSDLKDKFEYLEKLEETKVELFGNPNHYYIKSK